MTVVPYNLMASLWEEELMLARYESDPVGWVIDKLGEEMWSKQREILEATTVHRKVVVKAGHGVGKSWLLARWGLWRTLIRAIGDAFLLTTAPTWDQVNLVLWAEMRAAQAHAVARSEKSGTPSPVPGEMLENAEWKIGKTVIGKGKSPADHNKHGFQGVRRRYPTIAVDEGCAVSRNHYVGLQTTMTPEASRMLVIGNPDDPNAYMHDICEGAPTDGSSGMSNAGWWVITISVFDSPFWTGEQVSKSLMEVLPNDVWLNERRLEYGEGSALWQSKILGQFPVDASNGIIPNSLLQPCLAERVWLDSQLTPTELGIDWARGGDQCVIRERRGMKLGRVWRSRDVDTVKTVEDALLRIKQTGATRVKCDSTGDGGHMTNHLRQLVEQAGIDCEVIGVNFSQKAIDPTQYVNARAELWYMGKLLSQNADWDLSILQREDGGNAVKAELLVAELAKDASGRIKVQSKDEIKARLKRSPDDADALLLAYYSPPAEVVTYSWGT